MIFLDAFGLTYALWLFYLAAMNLLRVYRLGTMKLPAKVFGVPIMVIAVLIDWLANWTIFTVLCLQFPVHWQELVTGRLKRYKDDNRERTFRRTLSAWLASDLLDQFDPSGRHV